MTIHMAKLVCWLCLLWLLLIPIGALYLLVDIGNFAAIAKANLPLPIQWFAVTDAQWYGLWILTVLYLSISYIGIIFLRRAFTSFAKGQWFDTENSKHLKHFAVFLLLQSIAKPLHFALSSLLLSLHHPSGEKVFAISIGSHEFLLLSAGLVMWVLSDLLVAGTKAAVENRQFV